MSGLVKSQTIQSVLWFDHLGCVKYSKNRLMKLFWSVKPEKCFQGLSYQNQSPEILMDHNDGHWNFDFDQPVKIEKNTDLKQKIVWRKTSQR
jgi:hypothetical protein